MDRPSASKRFRVEEDSCDSVEDYFSDNSVYEYNFTRDEDDMDNEVASEFENDDDDSEQTETYPQTNQTSSTDFREWTNVKTHPISIYFSRKPGIKIEMPSKEPIDYFDLIANDDFYNLVISQTNAYAVHVLAHSKSEKSRISRWKDITKNDFKIWLGLLLHTGTIRLNRLNDYWKTDHLFNLPVFSLFMSRDKFLLIMRALYFNCNDEQDSSLGKIKPLIIFFNDRMEVIYDPKQQLLIDESLVLWKGRFIIRQYTRNIRANSGIKLYMLREASGIALKLVVYGGSAGKELGGRDHAGKVVHKLIEGKTGIGHSVYMDNLYNSVPLVRNLLNQKTYVTGMLDRNKKLNPDEVMQKTLGSGECMSQYTEDGICVTKWKHHREVLAISSEFDGELIETTNKQGKAAEIPKMVIEFNKHMSGIDYHDHMLTYYPCERKALRWYKKLGVHLFQTMLINAYYLYNSDSPKTMSLYDFRLSIIKKLLGPPPTPAPTPPKNRIHLPSYCEKDKAGKTQRRRCKYCWSVSQQRKASIFCCPDCPKKPGFCLEPCFRLYHEKNNLM